MSFVKLLIRKFCMKTFNIEKLQHQLEFDEGVVNEIYADHLGYKTFGIGHLITKNDPEFGKPLGYLIDEERVEGAFEADLANILTDCKHAFEGWDSYPEEAQQVFANMMFNMGRTRIVKFKKMIKAANAGDWKEAGVQGRDSRWYSQVTKRAERLMIRLESI
jgi:GH24 family phage-related lysozyme (muramidase)